MAITQAQRVSLHANLVDLMGQQDAEALTGTNAAITTGLTGTNAAIIAGLAEATQERAQLAADQAKDARREAKNLYITVSTIVLATISIWIALLVSMPSAG